jgi:hypothetical protein
MNAMGIGDIAFNWARLHGRDESDERVCRCQWPPQGEGNMDIELTVDAMKLANHIDQMVLFRVTAISGHWSRRCSAAACG